MQNFVEELRWRGMIHDIMPGAEELLSKEMVLGYLGIDPTADSLHIGHLVGVVMLRHFQNAGHRPIALLGGATGMIGDPSGKSSERNLLNEEVLKYNVEQIKKQLEKFLDFNGNTANSALLLNNYDWMKEISFLDFIRDIGKHITINYMMAKDSVKKRLKGENAQGLSFTEFSYQLVQGNDFLELFNTYQCKLQMGGSDQWGNIVTGTELIRRKTGGEAFGLTCPLITKADGSKFGKSESGNIWLDSEKTSPYKFYQFWLNSSDEDAEKYIKIFTFLSKEEIEEIITQHREAPHLRQLQSVLAKSLTEMVHSLQDYEHAVEASKILFGNATSGELKKLSREMMYEIFEGVPQFSLPREELNGGLSIVDLIAEKTLIFPSKGDARRTLKENALSLNKVKVNMEYVVTAEDIIADRYLLVQKGKKNYYLITVE